MLHCALAPQLGLQVNGGSGAGQRFEKVDTISPVLSIPLPKPTSRNQLASDVTLVNVSGIALEPHSPIVNEYIPIWYHGSFGEVGFADHVKGAAILS